jgi:hypothetical protein
VTSITQPSSRRERSGDLGSSASFTARKRRPSRTCRWIVEDPGPSASSRLAQWPSSTNITRPSAVSAEATVGQSSRRDPLYMTTFLPATGRTLPVTALVGDVLGVSGALPGSVHDKKAEWIWGVLDELEKAGLVTLADKGYQGSKWAKIPYKGKNKPVPQKEANRAHARLRAPR